MVMSKGRLFESLVGLGVLFVAAAFLYYAFLASGRGEIADAYPLKAVFGRIDGVNVGSDVRVSGVKVGAVTGSALDPDTYEARVTFSISSGVAVPDDSIAKIVSDGLLGGAHIAIEPGGSDIMLAAGDTITITQGSVDLLGLAVQAFSNNAQSGASSPAPQPETPVDPLGELQ